MKTAPEIRLINTDLYCCVTVVNYPIICDYSDRNITKKLHNE